VELRSHVAYLARWLQSWGITEKGLAMNGKTLDEARAAKPKALAAFSRQASVVGVGITRVDDGYGVKVNLGEPPSAGTVLPESIDGVPVRVEVVGTIRKR
jgi:hypothetical protein